MWNSLFEKQAYHWAIVQLNNESNTPIQKLRPGGSVQGHTEVSCLLHVPLYLWPASVDITCPKPHHCVSCTRPLELFRPQLCCSAQQSDKSDFPRLLFLRRHLTFPFIFSPPTAYYPWRLCGSLWRWAGWRHSSHDGESDNREWWLHGAIRGPEDDGR